MRRLIWAGVIVIGLALAAVVYLWPRPQNHSLVLYCALDYCVDVAHAYTRASGIPVEVVRLSTGPMLARITAEGHNPHWNLAWFDGSEAAEGLAKAGLAAKGLSLPVHWNKLGQQELSPDGAYIPTGLTLAGVFVVPRSFAAGPTLTWKDLLKPELHGRFGMNNPAISGPALPVLAGLLTQGGGWPAGQGFVEALQHNGMHVYAKNNVTLTALKNGEIEIAIVQSSAAYYWQRHDPGLRVILPKPAFDLPSIMVESAALDAQQRAAAEIFMGFVLSATGNRLRVNQGSADSLYWPLIQSAQPNPLLPDIHPLTVQHLDPVYWGGLDRRLSPWFSKVMGLN
ncbi:MAG: extracellular solute-binding protein [Gammaproteobacteria bacterium]|nr:extracellular solute-binding protein [Gammaproteobacteria bacterium]